MADEISDDEKCRLLTELRRVQDEEFRMTRPRAWAALQDQLKRVEREYARQCNANVPLGELWFMEQLSPIQAAAGFTPRILGKIVNIDED